MLKRPAIVVKKEIIKYFLYRAASYNQSLRPPCMCGENGRLELLPKHFYCCLILVVVEVKPNRSPALYEYEGNANPNPVLELSDAFA